MLYYVNEYPIGFAIVRSNRPSAERWPISHGPFESAELAEHWAATNLSKEED